MSTPAPHEVTQLLAAVSGGDSHAAAQLLPLVYDELRKLAKSRMSHEASGQTLEPTALVHEAYLRLLGDTNVGWDNRGHFFAAAALAMRRILVERARSRNRIKRGGGKGKVELTDAVLSTEPPSDDLLALDEALDRLEKYDKRKAEVVMLRYFAGLSIEDTAAALNLSPATVKNEWTFARAWLHREVAKDGE
ncbi:MAG: sigma-70 family RNA polymerase sigma factor [Pyrinomonadaceae bacterium]|nr:sigma-70 family RNA polymerase sigma factor [Phycisphaerales bacterium]